MLRLEWEGRGMRNLKIILLGLMCFALFLTCSTSDCDVARVRFAFYRSSATAPVQKEMLHIKFQDDRLVREAHGSDFSSEPDFVTPHSKWYDTRTSGTVIVDISLVTESGDTVAVGDLSLTLRPDWYWQVDVLIRDSNPMELCIGCFGHRAFELEEAYRESATDSLHVTWGGNSISDPVIY